MNIYVIRHGRTDMNNAGIFNGRNDEDINETGISQAEIAREELKNTNIDMIFCSPLKRTRHTCEIINTKNIPVIYDDRLLERDMKEFTLTPVANINREEYWNYYSTKYKNVETVKEIFDRVHNFLDEIIEKYSNQNILIVTHNGVSRGIYTYFHGIPEDGKLLNLGQKNCEIKKYVAKGNK